MTAEEIRALSQSVFSKTSGVSAPLRDHLLAEIAAQLAELNQKLSFPPSSSPFLSLERIASAAEGLERK
jgi:hypothetical protein